MDVIFLPTKKHICTYIQYLRVCITMYVHTHPHKLHVCICQQHTKASTNVCEHYTGTYVHTYTHTCMYVNTHTHTYVRTYIQMYVHTYMPTYINTYARTWVYKTTCIRTHVPTQRHQHTNTHVHICAQDGSLLVGELKELYNIATSNSYY